MTQAPRSEPPSHLYRWFDDQGRLLYVGISTDPTCREYEHRSWSWWIRWAERVAVDYDAPMPRDEAEDVERLAWRAVCASGSRRASGPWVR